MKQARILGVLLFLSLVPSDAHADIRWTGSAGVSIFNDQSWDLTNSTVTAVDPNVPVADNVVMQGPAPDALITNATGQSSLQVADGFMMTVDNMRVFAGADDGIGSEPGASIGVVIRLINGAQFEPYFVVNRAHLEIDPTSRVFLGGPGNPLNGSTVNMTFGSRLDFLQEDPAEFRQEHLSKVTVNGQVAIEGVNLQIDSDGNQGTLVTVIQQPVGVNFCAAQPNSTGASARMGGLGSADVAFNNLTLQCSDMPRQVFGFFLVSRIQGFTAGPGGSSGDLCLGGAIGRYVGAGEIQFSGQAGQFALGLDLAAIPQPAGFVGAIPGESWSFQTWYRDMASTGSATSNFSDGLEVVMQ